MQDSNRPQHSETQFWVLSYGDYAFVTIENYARLPVCLCVAPKVGRMIPLKLRDGFITMGLSQK